MPSNEGIAGLARPAPFKVLVLGGSYGGLAAALNLLDLCNGRSSRFAAEPFQPGKFGRVPVDITLVDERDGYCEQIRIHGTCCVADDQSTDRLLQFI